MDFNPFTTSLHTATTTVDRLRSEFTKLVADVERFNNTSWDDLVDKSEELDHEQLTALARDLERWEVGEAVGDMLQTKHPRVDVWADVVVLLNARADHWKKLSAKAGQARDKVRGQLKWFDGFDKQGAEDRIAHLRAELEAAESERDQLEADWRRVEEALAQIVTQIGGLDQQISTVTKRLALAKRFVQGLNGAHEPRDRALIHVQCEQVLGSGKPGNIASDAERLFAKLTRDRDKCVTRAQEIARSNSLVVSRIVIDGSNLCFASGSERIGLDALRVVVPDMASKYETFVVFDASTVSWLGMKDRDIQDRLGPKAKLHIMPKKHQADETVLDLAGANDSYFVLSNDCYRDYPDKPAVVAGRVLRHEIVDGRVFIRSLNYEAVWKSSPGRPPRLAPEDK